MEGLFYLILIILGLYLLFAVVLPAAAFVGGIAAIIISVIALAVGGYFAVKNYITAIKYNLNFVKWDWKKSSEPAVRSYFFGPGYIQLYDTIRNAFKLNIRSGSRLWSDAAAWRGDDGIWGFCKNLGSYLYGIVSLLSVYGLGSFLCLLLGLIHGSITTIVMIGSYIVFTAVYVIDWIYLFRNRIRSDCPTCHKRYMVPVFVCPNCSYPHRKLVPGPYGIFHHTCTCGCKLPCTFMNGRSKLEAYCPSCLSPLVASDARPIVFQLIGGSKAGKTVYLSAFFHQYLQKLAASKNLTLTIDKQYQPYFNDLESFYQGADCPATAQRNSQMYPVLIDSNLGVRRQFSIYDIAGEMFDGYSSESEVSQEQFRYCDGLLFLLDPFSSGALRAARISSGESLGDFSDMAADDVATNFINYMVQNGLMKTTARCNIPISVLIAKSDIREVRREIGPTKIRSVYNRNPDAYASLQEAQDSMCRDFLISIGFSSTVDNLESQFVNLHYFPVSAMGHSADGTAYEPWGITEAVDWMLPLADQELSNLLSSNVPASVQV